MDVTTALQCRNYVAMGVVNAIPRTKFAVVSSRNATNSAHGVYGGGPQVTPEVAKLILPMLLLFFFFLEFG